MHLVLSSFVLLCMTALADPDPNEITPAHGKTQLLRVFKEGGIERQKAFLEELRETIAVEQYPSRKQEYYDVINSALGSEHDSVRGAAANALISLTGDPSSFLASNDPVIRDKAVSRLKLFWVIQNYSSVRDELIKIASGDPNPRVRGEAFDWLRYADVRDIETLHALQDLSQGDGEFAQKAKTYLTTLTEKTIDPTTEDTKALMFQIKNGARIPGNEEALLDLVKNHSNKTVRIMAAEKMAKWGIDTFERVFNSTNDADVLMKATSVIRNWVPKITTEDELLRRERLFQKMAQRENSAFTRTHGIRLLAELALQEHPLNDESLKLLALSQKDSKLMSYSALDRRQIVESVDQALIRLQLLDASRVEKARAQADELVAKMRPSPPPQKEAPSVDMERLKEIERKLLGTHRDAKLEALEMIQTKAYDSEIIRAEILKLIEEGTDPELSRAALDAAVELPIPHVSVKNALFALVDGKYENTKFAFKHLTSIFSGDPKVVKILTGVVDAPKKWLPGLQQSARRYLAEMRKRENPQPVSSASVPLTAPSDPEGEAAEVVRPTNSGTLSANVTKGTPYGDLLRYIGREFDLKTRKAAMTNLKIFPAQSANTLDHLKAIITDTNEDLALREYAVSQLRQLKLGKGLKRADIEDYLIDLANDRSLDEALRLEAIQGLYRMRHDPVERDNAIEAVKMGANCPLNRMAIPKK